MCKNTIESTKKGALRWVYLYVALWCCCLPFIEMVPVLDSCVICSSRTNITCATDPESHQRSVCEMSTTMRKGCYTRILEGFTIRGCASELDEDVMTGCNNDDRCSTCIDFGCNNMVFPDHRHRCHQCRGAVNETCDGIPTGLPTLCEMYDTNDRCYILRTNTEVVRGCSSSRGTNCENPNHCYFCEITGCNNLSGDSGDIPVAPGSAVTNTISMVMLSIAFIFALAQTNLN